MTINELRTAVERKKGERSLVIQNLKELRLQIRDGKKHLLHCEKAREVLRQVALKIQESLQYHLSDITSLALEAIFPEPYKLQVEFVQRRNKTECDLLFEKNGEMFNPLSDSGGGVVDVAAFALRVSLWTLSRPQPRNLIIMDEPLRFLSAEYQEKASTMIKDLSEKLKIQFLIVTHEDKLTENADKIFKVTLNKGISQITEIK